MFNNFFRECGTDTRQSLQLGRVGSVYVYRGIGGLRDTPIGEMRFDLFRCACTASDYRDDKQDQTDVKEIAGE
jgi:hypothetical protein